MDIEMKVRPHILEYILHGTKRVEMRIYDEKRKQIQIGDCIIFKNHFQEEIRFRTKVVDIKLYKNFSELIDNYSIEELMCADTSKEELLKELEKYYPIEEQEANGVVALRFELEENGGNL